MKMYRFYPMTLENAVQISTWKYQEPYSFYNMEESDECISELMNGEYYFVIDAHNLLVGFLCVGSSARVPDGFLAGIYDDSNSNLDIGLGLRPDLTGRGKGQLFLSYCISFLNGQFKDVNYQLVVAEFNQRAITTYVRAGFSKGKRFKCKVEEREIYFIQMKYMNMEEL